MPVIRPGWTAAVSRWAVALLAGAAVVLLPPDLDRWSAVVAGLRTGTPHLRLDEVAASAAATGLWGLGVWVAVALVAGRVAALPGAVGAAGRLAVRVCVPRVLRGVVLGGVAGGLLLGPAVAAGATPVWPTSPPASAGATPGPVWPTGTAPPSETAPPSDSTVVPAPTAPVPPAVPTTAGATSVVVAPGDSLWSIAAADLQRRGDAPTAARIAATWPAWYAVNRAEIGPDPGLLHPGTHLAAPAPTDGSTR